MGIRVANDRFADGPLEGVVPTPVKPAALGSIHE